MVTAGVSINLVLQPTGQCRARIGGSSRHQDARAKDIPPARVVLLLALLGGAAESLRAQAHVAKECQRSEQDTLPPAPVLEALRDLGGKGTSVMRALRVCGAPSRWLALVILPSRNHGIDYGWRFALVTDSLATARVVEVTRGQRDSHAPDYRLVRAGHRYLLLAQLGDEGGSWGLDTYEVSASSITSLGILDVGDPAVGDNDQPNLPDARPFWTGEAWSVAFRKPVVLRPNQERRRIVSPPAGGEVIFRWRNGWQRVD